MDGKGLAALAAGVVVGLLVVGLGLAVALHQGGGVPGTVVLHGDVGSGIVEARRGQIVELDLGPGYSAPASSDQAVLAPVSGTANCDAGRQCWRFAARGTGLATLSAQRRAVCSPGEMCPLFIFLWSVQVRVNA